MTDQSPYAVVDSRGNVVATFPSCPEASAYADRHARMTVEYTRSGKRPMSDMHTVALDRLEHYRQQLREAIA